MSASGLATETSDLAEFHIGDRVVRARLPAGWKLRRYVANHHYVEIEDPNGEVVRLPATSLVKGECRDCSQVFFVESRLGAMTCPHCGGGVSWVWGRARLAFIAEAEAHFQSIPPAPPSDGEKKP